MGKGGQGRLEMEMEIRDHSKDSGRLDQIFERVKQKKRDLSTDKEVTGRDEMGRIGLDRTGQDWV